MCFESWERNGKLLYLHQHLHPKKGKRCIKGRDLVTGNNKAIHPLPSTDHFSTTDSHLLSTNPPKNTQEEE
jgi:hypothetical protein